MDPYTFHPCRRHQVPYPATAYTPNIASMDLHQRRAQSDHFRRRTVNILRICLREATKLTLSFSKGLFRGLSPSCESRLFILADIWVTDTTFLP